MSNVHIRTNARCIQDAVTERLLNKDDLPEVRQLFRQIIAHVKEILKADEEGRPGPYAGSAM